MAYRRNGKISMDEDLIEWDLTDFAIEESIIKRRYIFKFFCCVHLEPKNLCYNSPMKSNFSAFESYYINW